MMGRYSIKQSGVNFCQLAFAAISAAGSPIQVGEQCYALITDWVCAAIRRERQICKEA